MSGDNAASQYKIAALESDYLYRTDSKSTYFRSILVSNYIILFKLWALAAFLCGATRFRRRNRHDIEQAGLQHHDL
jgi:hypothetical protein